MLLGILFPPQKSHDLFHVIMDTPISLAFTTKKWPAARHMTDGAYNWDKFLPWVGDPSHMFTFLNHHFELIATSDENWEVPIQNALPLANDKWFNAPEPFMDADQMRRLCAGWASSVDGIEHTCDVQEAVLAVLFGMINSPHWRPHIVPNKWKLSEYFSSVPDDSQPLRRCLDNPDLIDAIRDVDEPSAMVL